MFFYYVNTYYDFIGKSNTKYWIKIPSGIKHYAHLHILY